MANKRLGNNVKRILLDCIVKYPGRTTMEYYEYLWIKAPKNQMPGRNAIAKTLVNAGYRTKNKEWVKVY